MTLTKLISLLVPAALLHAGVDMRLWEFRQPVDVPAPGQTYVLRLAPELYRFARPDFADLRLVHDGAAVAYVIRSLDASGGIREFSAHVADRVVAPGEGLKLTLDLGRTAAHNRLSFSTPRTNFRVRVRIETSPDNRSWAVAREDAYIFDFTEAGRRVNVLDVNYPESTQRYVRATFEGWSDPDSVSDASVQHSVEIPATWVTLDTPAFRRRENAEKKETVLELDLGARPPVFSQMRLETGQSWFHRSCRLEASADGDQWQDVAGGVLYHLPEGVSSAVDVAEQRMRYWRVHVDNADDRPIEIRGVHLEAIAREIRFVAPSAGQYFLYSGNAAAERPVYDLPYILAQTQPGAATAVTAGPVSANPSYAPPVPTVPTVPWTERHRELLYAVMGLAILILGGLSVRLLRGVSLSNPDQRPPA